jgi:hypothetical protein
VTLDHEVAFDLDLALAPADALAFVRDVPRSLSRADFLRSLHLEGEAPTVVVAELPVNAALFGQRLLPFRSELRHTDQGAALVALPIDHDGPGWAAVDGDAVVERSPTGSRVRYHFKVRVHLRLPDAERWGGQALLRMIEYTAQTVLERVTAAFPQALGAAARDAEASLVGSGPPAEAGAPA